MHIRELVHLREMLRKYPEQSDRLAKEAIVYSLPPTHVKLYEWIRQRVVKVDTDTVCQAWNWKPNYASTLLNELWQFGLLTRSQDNESSKAFSYEAG